jgi:hypothetical protein
MRLKATLRLPQPESTHEVFQFSNRNVSYSFQKSIHGNTRGTGFAINTDFANLESKEPMRGSYRRGGARPYQGDGRVDRTVVAERGGISGATEACCDAGLLSEGRTALWRTIWQAVQ